MNKRNVSHEDHPNGTGGFIVVHNGDALEVVNLAHVRRITTEPWGDGGLTRIIFNRPVRDETEDPFYASESIEEVLDLIEAAR